LKIDLNDGGVENITAKNIIIATGSEVTPLPNVNIDEKYILSSTGILELTEVPKKLLVIGGGVIGLEMASVWNNYGSHVEIVEFLDRVLPLEDEDVSKEALKIFKKKGLNFTLETKVNKATVLKNENCVEVEYEDIKSGKKTVNKYDKVLVSIGRKANTLKLNLDKAGIQYNKNGKIIINKNHKNLLQTNVNHIFAIGDCVEGPMLAHKAEEDGVGVVDYIVDGSGHIDWHLVPGVVYT